MRMNASDVSVFRNCRWPKIGGNPWGFPTWVQVPRSGLARWVAKAMVSSLSGGLARHGGSPARAKQCISKAQADEAQETFRESEPMQQQAQGSRPQGASVLGTDLGDKTPGLKARLGASMGSLPGRVPRGRSPRKRPSPVGG